MRRRCHEKMMTENHQDDPLWALYERPGYLVRRAHQIMDAAFMEAMADLALTPAQYGALFAIEAQEGIDQAGLARALRFDRSTMGLVVSNLEKRQLITRTPDDSDKRKRLLHLTDEGRRLLAIAHERGAESRSSVMAIYGEGQERQLIELLATFIQAWDKLPE